MKKAEKIFVSMTSLGVVLNNVAYAATEVVEESKEGFPMKYVFMGVAALVIALLLFLGYKMDTKGDETTKVSHKAEKTKKKLNEKAEAMQQNSGSYEADDDDAYEEDGEFDNDDLNESEEYNDEEEDSLYAMAEEDDDKEEEPEDDDKDINFESGFSAGASSSEQPVDKNEEDNDEKEEEPEGEEFDTSIIDGLDDDSSDTKNSFDDTTLFNSSNFSANGNSLEDEIDNLDNNEDAELIDINSEDDNFIEELKSFEEPETSFGGFSVASSDKEERMEELKDIEDAKNVEVADKKIEPKEKEVEKEDIETVSMDDDFLSQMEANLQKSQENRKARASKSKTTSSKKTTTKKEDK